MKNPSFADLGLCDELLQAITKIGYTTPTPIQAQAIPIVLKGGDVMGSAQTGTGKTAGFALPILQKLMAHANTSPSPARHPIRALILAPTRELAIQNEAAIATYAQNTQLRSTVVFGGVNIKQQTPTLMKGVEVLVATPGRLLDHVEQKTIALNQVEFFVLDEADRMLDMGFIPDIRKILRLLPKKRQSLLFSATFSKEIKKLAEDMLNEPILVEVARRNTAAETVQQHVCFCDPAKKRAALEKLITEKNVWQALCFVRTRQMAVVLCRALKKSGIAADAIHGDKTQAARLDTLAAFKSGKTQVLVATDVAARGIDIEELPMVINYDIPTAPEDYVHRIGRTGRAGASGTAITFVSPAEEEYLIAIEKLIGQKIPRLTLEMPADDASPRTSRRGDRAKSVSDEDTDRRRPRENEERRSREENARRPRDVEEREARYAKNPDQAPQRKIKTPATSAISSTESFSISSLHARLLEMRRLQVKQNPVPALLIKKSITFDAAPERVSITTEKRIRDKAEETEKVEKTEKTAIEKTTEKASEKTSSKPSKKVARRSAKRAPAKKHSRKKAVA